MRRSSIRALMGVWTADAAVAFFEPRVRTQPAAPVPRFDFVGPTVLSIGNAAILTYNLITYDMNGAVTSRWNFSEVYRLSHGRWTIVQSHASLVHGQPPAAAR